ncbi:winged helix-turn-helix transcriptional regulator [Krasilnikovia sp. MM14-A1259]|uniref:winged helix-turn-helix transcriptional regulator n=1 Tax=Krasilnikovia sp. MM14-A1259 TaxID=3373539 RepID=UPI00399CF78C
MLGRTYEDQVCSVARTLEVLGERWTLLVVRDALNGLSRFEEFQHSLGVARNVLADRLKRLVEAGVLERVRYCERPERFRYELTPKGRELGVPILSLMHWGDRHLAGPAGPPRLTRHRDCGGDLHARLVCERCGQPVSSSGLDLSYADWVPADARGVVR